MELSQDLVGKYVTVQLARPLYVTEYSLTVLDAKSQAVLGYVLQPAVTPASEGEPQPMVMDLFVGVEVKRITPTSLVFEYISPQLHLIERTVPLGMVLSCDRLTKFKPSDLPRMDNQSQRRIVAP